MPPILLNRRNCQDVFSFAERHAYIICMPAVALDPTRSFSKWVEAERRRSPLWNRIFIFRVRLPSTHRPNLNLRRRRGSGLTANLQRPGVPNAAPQVCRGQMPHAVRRFREWLVPSTFLQAFGGRGIEWPWAGSCRTKEPKHHRSLIRFEARAI